MKSANMSWMPSVVCLTLLILASVPAHATCLTDEELASEYWRRSIAISRQSLTEGEAAMVRLKAFEACLNSADEDRRRNLLWTYSVCQMLDELIREAPQYGYCVEDIDVWDFDEWSGRLLIEVQQWEAHAPTCPLKAPR